MLTSNHAKPFISQLLLVASVIFVLAIGLLNFPFTISFIQDTKIYLTLVFALLLVGVYAVFSLRKKSLGLVLSPLFWPLGLFFLATIASTFIAPAYPVENLLGSGGVYLAFAVIALIGSNILPKKSEGVLLKAVALVGFINVIGAGLQLAGFGPAQLLNRLFTLDLPKDLSFSLIGGSLFSLEVIAIGLVGLIWQAVKNKKVELFTSIVIPILVIGLGIYGWSARPGGPSPIKLPSLLASWSVTLDSLRAPKTALIGSGPETFINNYRQFKPTWVNGTADWSLAFSSANNLPLTLLATMGFMGLLSWAWLTYKVFRLFVKDLKETQKSDLIAPLCFSFLLNLFLPGSAVIFFIQAMMLAAFIASKKDQLPNLEVGNLNLYIASPDKLIDAFSSQSRVKGTNLPAYFLSALLLVACLFGFYNLERSYRSQVLLLEANKAVQSNDATSVYELQQQSVTLNPYLDVNRRSYALTNVMIAAALANKTDASEEEKQQVNLLLQQAVREARAATVLDPNDTQNWQVLANVYSNMIGSVQDADQWATQAYVSAIQTFPTDPNVRIAFGGVLLATKQLDQAINVFAQTVDIKPDFANSQYNLAVALRQANRLEEAKAAYQKTLALVDSSSEDFIKLTQEIETLDKEIEKLPKKTQTGTQQVDGQLQSDSITDQQINSNQGDILAPQPEQDIILPETTAPTN